MSVDLRRISKSENALEIAFVDPGIADVGALISGCRPGVEVFLLSPTRPALQQIARAVEGRTPGVVHIIAHGRPGEVNFASGALTLDMLARCTADLSGIGNALGDHGSLLLWSCDTGQGARGKAFVEALAHATGVPVAASSNPVGSADLGGGWDLDERQGAAHVLAPLTNLGAASYSGLLAVVNATAREDLFTGLGPVNGTANTSNANDTIIYTAPNQVDNTLADPANNIAQTIDSINGGDGFDTIQIGVAGNGVAIDLAKPNAVGPALFFNIEALAFANTGTASSAKLVAEQFGAGLISNSLAVTGVGGSVQNITIDFFNAAGGTFDASAWTFANWTSGTDTIVIRGSTGNDIITGSTMADTIDGNTGNDTINVANGYFAAGESINGGADTDTLVLTDATTVDFSTGLVGQIEILTGSVGDDVVTMSFAQWGSFTNSIDLGAGINTLNVLASTIGVIGGGAVGTPASIANITTGNLVGTAGNETVTMSGAQLDAIIIGAGTIDLGGGTDTINLTSTSADLNALGATDASISGVEVISAAGAAAGATITLTGQTEGFTITGGNGADVITGGAGADIISAGGGADTVAGGLGNDTINLASGNFIAGESIDGGADSDAIVLTNATTVDFSVGTITAVETLTGSAASDTVTMTDAQWVGFTSIDLAGGANVLNVVASSDISAAAIPALANVTTGNLRGTAGNNTTTMSGAELDAIIVGGGTIDLGLGAADTINLTSTSADLNALGANNNSIANVEVISAATAAAGVTISLSGQVEAFTLTGGVGDDNLTGGTGGDNINGGGGNDNLTGNSGADTISGGIGNDTITGGTGADTLTGGADGDVFSFAAGDSALAISGNLTAGAVAGFDTISDFAAGSVLSGSDSIGYAAAAVAANTASTNGVNSILQLHTAATVASHSITNGVITFDDADTFAAAVPLQSTNDVAAVADYLQRNSLGAVGTTVAFTAIIGGVNHTYLYIEGGANGTDELVDLLNVKATSITAATDKISVFVAPVANPDTLQATEDTAITYTAASLLGNDINATSIASVTSGTGGTAVLNANGTVTFTPDLNFNGPATFSYIATDGVLNSTSGTVTVNVAPVNDAPVAVADTGNAVEAGVAAGSNATGNVLANDTDVDIGDTKTVTTPTAPGGLAGLHGTLTLSADGSYIYAVNNADAAVNALRLATDTLTDTFNYTMRDAAGLTSSSTLTITIHGANDAPVALADTAAATEDAAVVTGTVATNDSDPDTGATRTYALNAPVAGLTLNANGSYAFDPSNLAYQHLAQGETVNVVANYTLTDDQGATATSTLTITLTGVNDVATIAGTSTGAVTEDGTLTAGNTLTVTDADTGQSVFQSPASLAGTFGTFAFNAATGQWGYTLANAQSNVQALTAGLVVHDTLTVTSLDGTATRIIDVAVTGANDVASIAGTSTGAVAEDGTLATGNTLTITDADAGQSSFQAPASLAGTFGTFAFNAATGQWGYALANGQANVQALTAGQVVHDTLSVASLDGTASRLIDVTVTGANDIAAIAGTSTGTVTEDGTLTAGNTLTITDADTGQSSFQTPASLAGTFGTFAFNAATGQWGYTLANAQANVQALTAGQVVHDTLSVTSLDGTASRLIDVTVTGVNDVASIAGTSTGAVTEDGTLTAGSTLTLTDADAAQSSFQAPASLAGTFGSFAFNAATGQWGYTLANAQANVQALTAGQIVHDTLTVTSLDGSATRLIDMTVTGTNDTPVAVSDTGTAIKAGLLPGSNATGNVLTNDTDVDTGDTKAVTTTGALVGAHGTLTLNANGSYTYVIDNADAAVIALHLATDTLTDTFNYTMRDTVGATSTANLTITIQGANDAPVITAGGASAATPIFTPENSADVALLTAADTGLPAQKLSWSLAPSAAGNDNALFAIDTTTGALKFLAAPDFENPSHGPLYKVAVSVSDGLIATARDVFVKVTDVAPVITDVNDNVGRTLLGTAENDTLSGLGGNDTLFGRAGNDLLLGGAGKDNLSGEDGNDILTGGLGKDRMTGGAGADVFDFNAPGESGKAAATRDVIADFKHLTDRIDLKDIDANTKLAADQAFKFIGLQAFHHLAGELHYFKVDNPGTVKDMTIIEGDRNGDGIADFQIELLHLVNLTKVDFVL